MTVLVTGGAGYIGSHTVRLLKERGRDVVALDSMEFGHAAAVGDVPLVRADVGDRRAVLDAIDRFGVDAVIHFAAYKSPAESMAQPQRYFGNNSCHTASLLETLHDAGVTPDRLLLDLRRVRHALVRARVRGRPDPSGEPLWREQGDHRAGVVLVRQLPGPAVGEPALLQCGRRLARRVDRGGLDRHHQPDPVADEGDARPERAPQGLWHGLPDSRWHRHPGLRARRRPGGRPPQGARTPRGRRRDHGRRISGPGSVRLSSRCSPRPSASPASPSRTSSRPRRPGDPVALYADDTKSKRVLGWSGTRTLDEVIASAYAWHSSHPDGYGD